MTMILRGQKCGYDEDCPEIQQEQGGGPLIITGYRPGAEYTAENEITVEFPAAGAPELASLNIPDFNAYRQRMCPGPGDMFRVQTLSRYGNEDGLADAYINGDPPPSAERLSGWGTKLDAYHVAGITYRNLHVVDGLLSDNLRMQFEWAYAFNSAHHMDIRIVDVAEIPAVRALPRLGDFWVLNDTHVALCRYDTDGRPLGHAAVEFSMANAYWAAADMAWQLSTPFATWWAAHPRYHRATQRAA